MSSTSILHGVRRQRPSLDGSLSVLSGYTDWHAEHHPSDPMTVFPHPSDPQSIMSVSYAEFAKVTHRVAHIVRPNRAGKDGEVAALLLNCDTIVYQALIVGLERAGIVVCLSLKVSSNDCLSTVVALPHVSAEHCRSGL